MNMMDMATVVAMMGPTPGQEQSGGGGMMNFVVMVALMLGIFYFMLIRPQQRKEKDLRSMIDNIKSGDRIMFCGGLLGTVTNVKDGAFVVKIADGVKIEVARGAVNKVLDKGDKADVESK